jgi:Na+/H+-dicarboxylate symporter
VVVFALFVGIALAIKGEAYPQLHKLFNEGFALCMQLVGWIMQLAPYGIMALLVKLVASENSGLTHFTEISAFCELKIVGNDSLVSK